MIKVKSARSDNRVALWERSAKHPGGEAFVAGRRVVEVALTKAVSDAIHAGELVVVNEQSQVEETGGETGDDTGDDDDPADDEEDSTGDADLPLPQSTGDGGDLVQISGVSATRKTQLLGLGIETLGDMAGVQDHALGQVAIAMKVSPSMVENWRAQARILVNQ